jgi:hypothetical protein
MRDRAVLDSGVIFALYFEEDASLRAVNAANEYNPITLDLAVAEVGKCCLEKSCLFRGEQRCHLALVFRMHKKSPARGLMPSDYSLSNE